MSRQRKVGPVGQPPPGGTARSAVPAVTASPACPNVRPTALVAYSNANGRNSPDPASVQPAYAEPLEFADVLAMAGRGDPGPCRILYDAGLVLGRSIAAFCTLLNPEAVVLAAGLGPAVEQVARGVREAIDRDAAPVTAERIEVVPGELADAEVAGSVALARERYVHA